MSKKANLKTCSFRHPSVSSYNIYPLLFAPKNKFFRALDFPRIFGQHPKNSAYHQNQQSERAWLSDLKAWRSTILLQLYGVLPNLLRAHYVKTWFSANFWATSEKQRLSSKRTEWTGLTFCLSSLTIYNPWQILQGGGLVTVQEELLHDSLLFYHMFPSLHLQNAGFAISSAEKRSIHRTEFDENDPISSL